MSLRNYGLGKPSLVKCLKSPVFEDPSKSNMVNGSKHCSNLNHNTFSIYIDSCEVNWFGKSLSNMLNLRTVCEHFDCRSQIFSS